MTVRCLSRNCFICCGCNHPEPLAINQNVIINPALIFFAFFTRDGFTFAIIQPIMLNKYNSLLLKYKSLSVAWVFMLCGYFLFAHLGGMALISPDEGRNAEVAREMAVDHTWLVPTYNGLTYLDKPAFYFKTVALSFSWFGESEATARLSSASFAFLLLLEVFWFCRKVYNLRTAKLAALIVAATPLYVVFAHFVIFDMTLAFFVCTAIFSCYLAEEQGREYQKRWYFIAAIATGIATLVKGPVGFILPTLVVTIFNVVEKRAEVMKQAFALRNWLVFFAIVLPWFIGLSLQCPDFPYYGIMKESLARFTTTEFRRTAPFYYYGVIIAVGFFPWSLILPEAIQSTWQNRTRLSRPDRFFIIWAIVVVIFFSISKSKLPGYILTDAVALGILCARVFADAFANINNKPFGIIRRSALALLLISLLLSLSVVAIILAPNLVTDHLSTDKIGKFQFFLPHLPILAFSFLATAVLCFVSYKLKNSRLVFATFLSIPLLILTVNFGLLAQFAESRSMRNLAGKLPDDLPATTQLACIQCLPKGLPFYSKRLITVFSTEGNEFTSNYIVYSLRSGKNWPDGIVPLSQMDNWLTKRERPVYLLAKTDHLPTLNGIAKQYGQEVFDLGSNYWAILLP